MAHNWKAVAKHGAITTGEVAVMGTSMILTKKFLDARVLFAKHIEKDPAFADKWYIKHQGAVKVVGGAIAATMIKNPWIRMIAIGIALEGFITEARVLTTNKETGVSFFESIGTADIDAEMLQAAKAISGEDDNLIFGDDNLPIENMSAVGAFGNEYNTQVGAFGNEFNTQVGFA